MEQNHITTPPRATEPPAIEPVSAPPAPKRGLPAAQGGKRTHALSNGAVLEYRRPRGYDAIQAGQVAGPEASNQETSAALVASVSTVDGERFAVEDFLGMDLAEINEVIELVLGKPRSPADAT